MIETTEFDAADYLDNPETIAAYLNEAFATEDASFIALAIETVARAKGSLSDENISRENPRKALNDTTKAEFETVRRILGLLDVQLIAQPKPRAA